MCTVLTLMTAENDLGANSSNSEHYSLDPSIRVLNRRRHPAIDRRLLGDL